MIVVTIELWPKGDQARKRHLGTAIITNDATGSEGLGNYRVTLSRRGQPDRPWRLSQVRGFPRQQLGAYDLLYRALAACVGGRNGATTT